MKRTPPVLKPTVWSAWAKAIQHNDPLWLLHWACLATNVEPNQPRVGFILGPYIEVWGAAHKAYRAGELVGFEDTRKNTRVVMTPKRGTTLTERRESMQRGEGIPMIPAGVIQEEETIIYSRAKDFLPWYETWRRGRDGFDMPEPLQEHAKAQPMRDPQPRGDAVFQLEGETVLLRFAGREHRAVVSKGARRVHEILSAGGKELRCDSVVEGHDQTLDAKGIRAVQKRLSDIESELEADLSLERREELQEEEAKLRGLLRPCGMKAKPLPNAQKREADTNSRNVRNFFKDIESVMPELAAHLKKSIALGLTSTYRPYPSVDWEL